MGERCRVRHACVQPCGDAHVQSAAVVGAHVRVLSGGAGSQPDVGAPFTGADARLPPPGLPLCRT
jgi:hypothetical protein